MAGPSNKNWKYDVTHDFMPFCEDQINYHRDNIRRLKTVSWAFFLTGLASTIIVFVFFKGDTKQVSDVIFKLGPLLVTAPIPAFLYRMILTSRQAVSPYTKWKDRLEVSLVRNEPPPTWVTDAVIKNMDEVAKPRS